MLLNKIEILLNKENNATFLHYINIHQKNGYKGSLLALQLEVITFYLYVTK
jgi:hypothetical protein